MPTVVIIGGGPAGYTAALRAAQLGANVVLVERYRLGGTCLHKGCIPTKTLLRSALLNKEIQRAEEFGLWVSPPIVHMETILARKRDVVGSLQSGLESLMVRNRIKVLYGRAELKEGRRVEVTTTQGVEELIADRVILATGSAPFMGPFSSSTVPNVMSSDDALECDSIPSRLVVIGGGVVGIELATFFSCLGSKVLILEQLPSVLQGVVDSDLVRYLLPSLKAAGVEVVTGCKIVDLFERDGSPCIQYESGGNVYEYVSEKVLVSIGRKPVLDGIDVERLGIKMAGPFIRVDSSLQTSLEGVFAAGDVIGKPLLAHAAYSEGEVAAEAACGMASRIDHRAMPVCVFSHPELASVGLTEAEAKSQGHRVAVSRIPFRGNGRAVAIGEPTGMVKLVADAESGELLGGHIVGATASELIHEIALAIAAKMKVQQLAKLAHAHPTLAETVKEAARALLQ